MESSPESHQGLKDYERIVVKGKRTKRQRLILQQPAGAMTTSSSGVGGDDDRSDRMSSSPTSSTDQFCGSTEEEEDMANCLILLAQGAFQPKLEEERFSSRKFTETATAKAGFYVYECKTCNRSFPSFQALGGHRASHKKPKMGEEKKAHQEEDINNIQITSASSSFSPPKPVPYNKSRVHECSICGSEFSSGQALGGHMRRHRSAIAESQEHSNRKERNVLSLDLNLPAPEEDRELIPAGGFTFSSKQQPLVFAASSLVDCPY